MAERPSFQFYPGAWRNNANLRRCCYAARAVWVDILCLLHDSDEYGALRWPLADIAMAANAPMELVQEVVDKGVLKGGDVGPVVYEHRPRHARQEGDPVMLVHSENGPCWYSSRMLVDEWRRKTKGIATRFTGKGGSHPSPSHAPSQRQGDGSSSSSSPLVAVATSGDDAQTTANQLSRLSNILGLAQSDFGKHASNLITLAQLKTEGCDFEADILPVAQRAAQGKRSVGSLRYIVAAARESRDGRKALASLPAPFEPTDATGWQNRLRGWKDRGAWLPKWGPAPDQNGCKCPSELLSEANGPHPSAELPPDQKSESPAGKRKLPGIGQPPTAFESVRAANDSCRNKGVAHG